MAVRAMLLRRLAHAADRIETGVRYIAKQRGIIDQLEADGRYPRVRAMTRAQWLRTSRR